MEKSNALPNQIIIIFDYLTLHLMSANVVTNRDNRQVNQVEGAKKILYILNTFVYQRKKYINILIHSGVKHHIFTEMFIHSFNCRSNWHNGQYRTMHTFAIRCRRKQHTISNSNEKKKIKKKSETQLTPTNRFGTSCGCNTLANIDVVEKSSILAKNHFSSSS